MHKERNEAIPEDGFAFSFLIFHFRIECGSLLDFLHFHIEYGKCIYGVLA